MAVNRTAESGFRPAAFESFRFLSRDLTEDGRAILRYALDDRYEFIEEVDLPVAGPLSVAERERVQGLISLLHWVSGVSYFKTAVPASVRCEGDVPGPAAAALLEALYSEGLGEFAFVNKLPALPRPTFIHGEPAQPARQPGGPAAARTLVPIGGGKDSIVALEILRGAGCEIALFSVGDASAIARTAEVASLPRLVAHRRIDPLLLALNGAGALNGHVPITAIVVCIALVTAALNGFGTVALANERSASSGNLDWDGVQVNHQFSKSLHAERLYRDAIAEISPEMNLYSVVRPASELAIARAFARLDSYDSAFTSCNAIFRLDATRRGASWCCDCPKCRFVFLMLAPFSEPTRLLGIFGKDLLADERQYPGFALLTATGGTKPFECVGEEEESVAAVRMLALSDRWRDHAVVRRLVAEVLPGCPPGFGEPSTVLRLADGHFVPDTLLPEVGAALGS